MRKKLIDLIDKSGMVEKRSRCEIIADELIAAGVCFAPTELVIRKDITDDMLRQVQNALSMPAMIMPYDPGQEVVEIVPRWIPVTERLPEIPDGWAEHPEPVLYMMKSTKTIYAGYYGENGTYRDKYFRQYHDRYEGVDADDVLCWMYQHDLPLPELPEEVQE